VLEVSQTSARSQQKQRERISKNQKSSTVSKGKTSKKKPSEKKDRGNAEKEKPSQKRKKSKQKKSEQPKKKRSRSSSHSESDSSGGSSSSGNSSSSNSSESDSSSHTSSENDSEARSKKSKKKKSGEKLDWELLDDLWPVEDRPRKLQHRKSCSGISMGKMMRMKASFEKEQEKRGLGVAIYSRDRKPKSKSFKAKKDDGAKKLHKARFLSLPRTEPELYWKLVPVNCQQVYRHQPLKHLGVDGVPETTIVKIHNRTVPIELDMIYKDAKEVNHVQLAVLYYIAVLRNIHPYDYSGLVIQNVLTGKNKIVFLSSGKCFLFNHGQ
jgi:hypothetical protein